MGGLCSGGVPGHVQVVVAGLDGAGKTSVVRRWQQQSWGWWVGADTRPVCPTGILPPEGGLRQQRGACEGRVNVDTVDHRGKRFVFIDLGGQADHRLRWREYIGDRTSAVVYVVDASAVRRLPEARDALHNVVMPLLPLPVTPLLVLCNKTDRLGAASVSAVAAALQLGPALGPRRWKVLGSSAASADGVPAEALAFLAEAHQQQQETLARHIRDVHPPGLSCAAEPDCGARLRRLRRFARRDVGPPEGTGPAEPAACTAEVRSDTQASSCCSCSAVGDSARDGTASADVQDGADAPDTAQRRKPRRRGRGRGRKKPGARSEAADAVDAAAAACC